MNPTTIETAMHPEAELPRGPLADAPFIDVGGTTDIGQKRVKNTDFFLTGELNRSLVLGPSSLQMAPGIPWIGGTQGRILVVADGITGAGLGEVASWAAVDGLAHYVANVLPWVIELHDNDERELVDAIKRGLKRCQARVRYEAERLGYADRPVGTTLTMAYIVWPHVHILHVGDSRAYLYRDCTLRQLTSDDTLAQRMVDHAVTTRERVNNTPFGHILTNAIGGDDDALEVEHHRFELKSGDQLLLCSNGLSRHLTPVDIQRELAKGATAATASRRLVAAANKAGGEDNITAVVAGVARRN